MFGAVELVVITSSGPFGPAFHCPATSGVLVTFLTGPLPQATGPTIVCALVATIESRIGFASRLFARFSTSIATSNSACLNPIGCVHGRFVEAV